MKWHFKLIKSSVALAFTSVLLASAVVAFFVKNAGFGWFSSNKQVAANGIRVEMDLVLYYGSNIPQVLEQLRTRIMLELDMYTALNTTAVVLTVQGITLRNKG